MPTFVLRPVSTARSDTPAERTTSVHSNFPVHIFMFYRFTGMLRVCGLFSVLFLDSYPSPFPLTLGPCEFIPSTVSHTLSRSMYGLFT